MRIGLCLSPETAVSWPAFPGDYLEVGVQHQLRPETGPEATAATAASHSIP